jgi:trimethylamine:corrinoid methyltransferase-like protein
MTSSRPPLEPLRTSQRLRCLTDEQLDSLQEATLRILEDVGVRFLETALAILADHGARIDRATQSCVSATWSAGL